MPEMTERQARVWPAAVNELNRAIETDWLTLHGGSWKMHWQDEVRPGRGHSLDAQWNDGEYYAQITMDVYGSYNASIASLDWIHTPMEDCDCPVCVAEREEEES